MCPSSLHTRLFDTRARFLSLARSKLRLCSAYHRAGYFSNLACDWLSIVWAYSEQETENGPTHMEPNLSHCYGKIHIISCQNPPSHVIMVETSHLCHYHISYLKSKEYQCIYYIKNQVGLRNDYSTHPVTFGTQKSVTVGHLCPLLLTWFNFNPSMDK